MQGRDQDFDAGIRPLIVDYARLRRKFEELSNDRPMNAHERVPQCSIYLVTSAYATASATSKDRHAGRFREKSDEFDEQ